MGVEHKDQSENAGQNKSSVDMHGVVRKVDGDGQRAGHREEE